jgi:hypothetical protein
LVSRLRSLPHSRDHEEQVQRDERERDPDKHVVVGIVLHAFYEPIELDPRPNEGQPRELGFGPPCWSDAAAELAIHTKELLSALDCSEKA